MRTVSYLYQIGVFEIFAKSVAANLFSPLFGCFLTGKLKQLPRWIRPPFPPRNFDSIPAWGLRLLSTLGIIMSVNHGLL